MNFSSALEGIKGGLRLARAGWNGKGMFVFIVNGGSINMRFGDGVTEPVESLPYIAMKTADGKIVPWLASQTDILAQDWALV